MLLITCPWCGEREETEFSYGGEGHIARPADSVSDREWTEYLFMRTNPKGQHRERWNHASGCRRWFGALRDTTTNKFLKFYKPGATPPKISESGK